MNAEPNTNDDPFGDDSYWEVDYSPLFDSENPVPYVTRYTKSGQPFMRVWGVSDPSIFDGTDEEDTEGTE